MKKNLWEIIEAPSGRLSSKRVCGILGWIVLLIGFLVLLFNTHVAPSFTEFLICAIVALLGVDSVTGAFNKKLTSEQTHEENGDNKS